MAKFICRHCEEELYDVQFSSRGYRTWTGVGSGTIGLEDLGDGEASLDWDRQYLDEFEDIDLTDSDETEEFRYFECPECGATEELLVDLVEVMSEDDEAEPDEDGYERWRDGTILVYTLVSAKEGKVQTGMVYRTLAEAKAACDTATTNGGLCVQGTVWTLWRDELTSGEVYAGPVLYVPAKTAARSEKENGWLLANLHSNGLTMADVSGASVASGSAEDDLDALVASLP